MRLPSWENDNSNRCFPLLENYELSNGVQLPSDLFLDFFMLVPGADFYFFNSLIINDGIFIEICNSTKSFGNLKLVKTVNEFELSDISITGSYVIGPGYEKLLNILGAGTYYFKNPAYLSSMCYAPIENIAVSSVGIKDHYVKLTDDIQIIPHNGLKFTPDGNTIRIDAVPSFDCDSFFEDKTPIKTINNLSPCGDAGFLYLTGKGIIRTFAGSGAYHGEKGQGIIISSMLDPKLGCPSPFPKVLRGPKGPDGDRGPRGGGGACAWCYCVNVELPPVEINITDPSVINPGGKGALPVLTDQAALGSLTASLAATSQIGALGAVVAALGPDFNPDASIQKLSYPLIFYLSPNFIEQRTAGAIKIRGDNFQTANMRLIQVSFYEKTTRALRKSFQVTTIDNNLAQFTITNTDFYDVENYCVSFVFAVFSGNDQILGSQWYYSKCSEFSVIQKVYLGTLFGGAEPEGCPFSLSSSYQIHSYKYTEDAPGTFKRVGLLPDIYGHNNQWTIMAFDRATESTEVLYYIIDNSSGSQIFTDYENFDTGDFYTIATGLPPALPVGTARYAINRSIYGDGASTVIRFHNSAYADETGNRRPYLLVVKEDGQGTEGTGSFTYAVREFWLLRLKADRSGWDTVYYETVGGYSVSSAYPQLRLNGLDINSSGEWCLDYYFYTNATTYTHFPILNGSAIVVPTWDTDPNFLAVLAANTPDSTSLIGSKKYVVNIAGSCMLDTWYATVPRYVYTSASGTITHEGFALIKYNRNILTWEVAERFENVICSIPGCKYIRVNFWFNEPIIFSGVNQGILPPKRVSNNILMTGEIREYTVGGGYVVYRRTWKNNFTTYITYTTQRRRDDIEMFWAMGKYYGRFIELTGHNKHILDTETMTFISPPAVEPYLPFGYDFVGGREVV